MKPKKLVEVESAHEQREPGILTDAYVREGAWIEVINFEPMHEKAEIMLRLLVERIEKKNSAKETTYRIICKEMDIEADQKQKERLAKAVLAKHGAMLKAGFAKSLIQGVARHSREGLKEMVLKAEGLG